MSEENLSIIKRVISLITLHLNCEGVKQGNGYSPCHARQIYEQAKHNYELELAKINNNKCKIVKDLNTFDLGCDVLQEFVYLNTPYASLTEQEQGEKESAAHDKLEVSQKKYIKEYNIKILRISETTVQLQPDYIRAYKRIKGD